MPSEDAIIVQGIVVRALPRTLFEVELPNGHRVLAHLPRRQRDEARVRTGDQVTMRMTPYDMSVGCIWLDKKDELK